MVLNVFNELWTLKLIRRRIGSYIEVFTIQKTSLRRIPHLNNQYLCMIHKSDSMINKRIELFAYLAFQLVLEMEQKLVSLVLMKHLV